MVVGGGGAGGDLLKNHTGGLRVHALQLAPTRSGACAPGAGGACWSNGAGLVGAGSLMLVRAV